MVAAESAPQLPSLSPASISLQPFSSSLSLGEQEIVKFGLESSSKETSASSVPPPYSKTGREAWGIWGEGCVRKRLLIQPPPKQLDLQV